MAQKNSSKYVAIATKVSPETAEQLEAICKAMGVDKYHIFQWFVQALVRMASPVHQLTPDIQKLMAVLESSVSWQKAFNICAPNKEMDIAQMVLILGQKGKKGFGAVMLDRPFMGECRQTECVDDILERTVEVCMPGIYRRLRALAVDMDCQSISDLLITLIDSQTILNLDRDNAEQMQGPADFHDYGRQVVYGQRTRQTKRKNMETIDKRQTRLDFVTDREVTAEDMEKETGFRPHGSEW